MIKALVGVDTQSPVYPCRSVYFSLRLFRVVVVVDVDVVIANWKQRDSIIMIIIIMNIICWMFERETRAWVLGKCTIQLFFFPHSFYSLYFHTFCFFSIARQCKARRVRSCFIISCQLFTAAAVAATHQHFYVSALSVCTAEWWTLLAFAKSSGMHNMLWQQTTWKDFFQTPRRLFEWMYVEWMTVHIYEHVKRVTPQQRHSACSDVLRAGHYRLTLAHN